MSNPNPNNIRRLFACLLLIPILAACGPENLKIGGIVWFDENRNGLQDEGEEGEEGVAVTLVFPEAASYDRLERRTVFTDESGRYEFPGFLNEDYNLEFSLPAAVEFTIRNVGDDDDIDSDVDPLTGETGSFFLAADRTNMDAGLVELGSLPELPPDTPTPTSAPPEPTPTETVEPPSNGEETPGEINLLTDDGFLVAYTGETQAASGGKLTVTFHVTDANGAPATGTFYATLGDPPTSSNATHANGELDAEGNITLMLDVNWPPGETKLLCSYNGAVYEVTVITISE